MAEETITLNFGKLPLMETAARVAFQAPIPLSYQMVNAIHAKIKDQFPRLAEPAQIEVAPGIGPSPSEFGPSQLPGVVYDGEANGLRVSVHPQVVVARWVKQFVADSPEYPRYDAVRSAMWRTIEATREVCGDDMSAILVTNISYVNFVEIKNPATVMQDYFSDMAQISATKDATQIRKVEASWADGDIDLRFAVEQATVKIAGAMRTGYRLTTAGGRRLSENIKAKTALDSVHDQLQRFFRELISDRAKREWQLEE